MIVALVERLEHGELHLRELNIWVTYLAPVLGDAHVFTPVRLAVGNVDGRRHAVDLQIIGPPELISTRCCRECDASFFVTPLGKIGICCANTCVSRAM